MNSWPKKISTIRIAFPAFTAILISLVGGIQPAEAHLTADGFYTRPGTAISVFLNTRAVPLSPPLLERLDFDLDLLPAKYFNGLQQIRTVGAKSGDNSAHALTPNIVTITVNQDPRYALSGLDSDLPAAIGAHAFFILPPPAQDEWLKMQRPSATRLELADSLGSAYGAWASNTKFFFFDDVKFMVDYYKMHPGSYLGGSELSDLLFACALFVKHGNRVATFSDNLNDPTVPPTRTYVSISRSDHWLTIDKTILRIDGGMITGALDQYGNLVTFTNSVTLPQILQDAVPLTPEQETSPTASSTNQNPSAANKTENRPKRSPIPSPSMIAPTFHLGHGPLVQLSNSTPDRNYRTLIDQHGHLIPEATAHPTSTSDAVDDIHNLETTSSASHDVVIQ